MQQWRAFWRWGIFFIFLLLSACADSHHYAPVVEISAIEPIPKSGKHQVEKGETLYEVAWRYGLDYREVASRNQIASSKPIYSGEVLYLRGQVKKKQSEKIVESKKSFEPNDKVSRWIWPAQGKVIGTFSRTNKGINIGNVSGTPIYASASGKVVYCGDGLRRYGNLIILKHNNVYLSAYAHNKKFLVKEGSWVKQGQKIAEMGNTGAERIMLHFEIRRAGKPVNPAALLN